MVRPRQFQIIIFNALPQFADTSLVEPFVSIRERKLKNLVSSTAACFLLCGCMTVNDAPSKAAPATTPAQQPPRPEIGGLQFLYGSGEAGAISAQTYRAFENHALAMAENRPRDSVILAAGATTANPTYVPCGDKPLAVVLDVDETVSLNTGLMHARATGTLAAVGSELPVRPAPGAVEAIRRLQQVGITPIYNTNRTVDMSELVADYLVSFGLDRPVQGETLFLNGMDAMGGNKDGRRATIARHWCVIAMAGDQLGDFTELLNEIEPASARRRAALSEPISRNWGNGWFLLPNTAYGRALEGELPEIFPDIHTTAE